MTKNFVLWQSEETKTLFGSRRAAKDIVPGAWVRFELKCSGYRNLIIVPIELHRNSSLFKC